MRRPLLALALAACTSAPPPSSPAPPPRPITSFAGEPPPNARIAGWDALVIGSRAFVIAPGFDAVEAYDPASGRRLWRTSLPEETHGRHELQDVGGAVALWAGNRMFTFDAATGKLVRKPDGVAWSTRCWLHRKRGVCAIGCECDAQIVDCTTGRPVGKRYDKTHVELFFDEDQGGASGGCYGPGGEIVGRSGDLAVIAIEDVDNLTGPGSLHDPLAFTGVELPSGRERYRIPAAPLSSTIAPSPTGTTADGRTCHAGDHNGRFIVWDCATGAALWTAPEVAWPGALPGHLVQTSAAGIFRRVGDTASLHDERTGAILWTRTIPATQFALLAGAPVPDLPSLGVASDRKLTSIVWLGPDGAELATAPLDGSIHEGDDGGLFVLGAALVAYDPSGRELARTTEPLPRNLTAFTDHLDVFGDGYALLDRALRVRLHVDGSAASAPGATLAAMAIYRWPPKGVDGPGEILLYSLAP